MAITTDEIAERLVSDGRVILKGFGTFTVKTRAARTGNDPRNGNPVAIPEKRKVAFKASPLLEQKVK